MPGRRAAADHPDHDLLADLAAQTLDPDLAARVAEHVEGCDQCGQLLADAEGITGALQSLPAEPMPADISQLLERALAAERARPAAGEVAAGYVAAGDVAVGGVAAGATPAAPPTMPIAASAPVSNVSSARTGELPTRRSLRAANTGGVDTGSFPPAPGSAPSSSVPSSTSSTGPIGTPGGPATGPSAYPLHDATPEQPGGPLTGSTRRIPIAGRGGAAGPATGSTGRVSEGAFARLTRPGGRDRQGARRQALEEQRSDQPSRVFPMLRVAAGVVLVLVVGAGVYKVVGGTRDSSSAGSTAAGAAGAAGGDAAALVLAPVLNTGTDYEKATLESQIRQLVSTSQKSLSSSGTVAGSKTQDYSSAEAANPAASPLAANTGSSGDLLKSDTALRACLTGLGEGDVQPVAVDLASYGGQDAAILVLPGPGGGYSVWVVGRDCTATQQTNIAQVNVPS